MTLFSDCIRALAAVDSQKARRSAVGFPSSRWATTS